MVIRDFKDSDLDRMLEIWNAVVEDGIYFGAEIPFDRTSGTDYFHQLVRCCVAVDEDDRVIGLYTLSANNFGRAGHIGNASYAVDEKHRGRHIGEALVRDSLMKAKEAGFRIMQFNAVLNQNKRALHVYEKIGFTDLGTIPGGFRVKDGSYVDVHVLYYDLMTLIL